MYDILLKNATIVDGTGKSGYVGDVAVANGKIAKIAKKVIDSAPHTISQDS